jgi:outer membrane protein TolC
MRGVEMSARPGPTRIIGVLLLGLLFALTAASSGAAQAPPSPGLSLEEIVAAALASNPQLAASRADVETARRQLEVNQTLGVPKLSLAANYEYFPTPAIVFPFVITMEIQKNGSYGGVAGVTLSLPLYTGGRIPLQIRIAELGALIAEHRLGETRQDLIFNLSSLYYTALRLDAAIVATQQSVASLESARKVVQEFVTVGKAPQIDLLRIEARLANVSQDLIGVQNAETVALATIETLMGTPVNTSIRVAGSLAGPPAAPQLAPPDVPSMTKEALQHRPEYLAVLAQQRQQEERVRLARAQMLPDVSLNAAYGVQGGQNTITQGVGQVMVGVTFPLFDATLSARSAGRKRPWLPSSTGSTASAWRSDWTSRKRCSPSRSRPPACRRRRPGWLRPGKPFGSSNSGSL